MPMADFDTARWEEIRSVVADALEIEPEEVGADSNFQHDLGADSLTRIEMLAALERRFDVVIKHDELDHLTNLTQAYRVVTEAIGRK